MIHSSLSAAPDDIPSLPDAEIAARIAAYDGDGALSRDLQAFWIRAGATVERGFTPIWRSGGSARGRDDGDPRGVDRFDIARHPAILFRTDRSQLGGGDSQAWR